jgi:hypothetical protein
VNSTPFTLHDKTSFEFRQTAGQVSKQTDYFSKTNRFLGGVKFETCPESGCETAYFTLTKSPKNVFFLAY